MSIDNIVEAISDGRWHSIDSLTRRFNIGKEKLKKAMDWLADFGFVQWSKEKNKVKVSQEYFQLIWDLRRQC